MKSWLGPGMFLVAVIALGGTVPGGTASAGPQTLVAQEGVERPSRERVVVVSRVARSARKHQPRLEAFAGWLATRLESRGIAAGAGLVARNPREMITFLREGRVDIVSESILTALHYENEAGAEILMHEWRAGRPHYQSVFITRSDGTIFRLEDLEGKRIAFEDRGSSSAFLLPAAVMIQAGLKPVELPRPEAPVPDGAVGYIFAGSEVNISAWTASGIVDAGAYSNRDWERKGANPNRYRGKMRVFQVTQPLPRSVLLVRPGMRPELKAAIRDALRDFGGAPDAASVRDRYYDVARYDAIDGGIAVDIEDARTIYRTVRHLLD